MITFTNSDTNAKVNFVGLDESKMFTIAKDST